jgi:hypothetical protein
MVSLPSMLLTQQCLSILGYAEDRRQRPGKKSVSHSLADTDKKGCGPACCKLPLHIPKPKSVLGICSLLLQAVNDEALAFQREKQVRLNQVEVVLLLRLHQIEYLQDGQLPSDLSGALLFSNTELDKLKHRVRVSCGHMLHYQCD